MNAVLWAVKPVFFRRQRGRFFAGAKLEVGVSSIPESLASVQSESTSESGSAQSGAGVRGEALEGVGGTGWAKDSSSAPLATRWCIALRACIFVSSTYRFQDSHMSNPDYHRIIKREVILRMSAYTRLPDVAVREGQVGFERRPVRVPVMT